MPRYKLRKFEREFRARIGKTAYDSAFNRFGPDLIRRAERLFQAQSRLKILKARAKKDRFKKRLQEIGLDDESIARTLIDVKLWKKPIDTQYFPVYKGPKRGSYEKIKGGKTLGFVSKKEALREMGKTRYLRRVRELSNGLGISISQSRVLYRDVRAQARRDLARLKKTAKFKALPERKKKGYTVKRWERGSLNALAALLDLYFMWA